MSLQSELTRLRANVLSAVTTQAAILSAIADKGVTVPPGATLHDVPGLIGKIDGTYPSVVTIGGRKYKTVVVGKQEWLAENLDYKFPYDGSNLPIGTSGVPDTPAAWYYDNSEASYGIDGTYKCGLLYNWYANQYLNEHRDALLPKWWHVPSASEIQTLVTNVGGENSSSIRAKNNSVTGSWPSNWNGTDDYGLNILPAGFRWGGDGNFYAVGSRTYISSCTTHEEYPTNQDALGIYDTECHFAGERFTSAFPIRLVKTLA